jgi:hypothetical protein
MFNNQNEMKEKRWVSEIKECRLFFRIYIWELHFWHLFCIMQIICTICVDNIWLNMENV